MSRIPYHRPIRYHHRSNSYKQKLYEDYIYSAIRREVQYQLAQLGLATADYPSNKQKHSNRDKADDESTKEKIDLQNYYIEKRHKNHKVQPGAKVRFQLPKKYCSGCEYVCRRCGQRM